MPGQPLPRPDPYRPAAILINRINVICGKTIFFGKGPYNSVSKPVKPILSSDPNVPFMVFVHSGYLITGKAVGISEGDKPIAFEQEEPRAGGAEPGIAVTVFVNTRDPVFGQATLTCHQSELPALELPYFALRMRVCYPDCAAGSLVYSPYLIRRGPLRVDISSDLRVHYSVKARPVVGPYDSGCGRKSLNRVRVSTTRVVRKELVILPSDRPAVGVNDE